MRSRDSYKGRHLLGSHSTLTSIRTQITTIIILPLRFQSEDLFATNLHTFLYFSFIRINHVLGPFINCPMYSNLGLPLLSFHASVISFLRAKLYVLYPFVTILFVIISIICRCTARSTRLHGRRKRAVCDRRRAERNLSFLFGLPVHRERRVT